MAQVKIPLLPTHIASRNDPDALASEREHNKKEPFRVGLAQAIVPLLGPGGMGRGRNQKRRAQKRLFGLPKSNPVFLPILGEITLIPIESNALAETVPEVHFG